ncbi:hypothetical protein CCYN2B_40066 [Capnocytophaga cynodegmi]|uniref:Uncharacterized protein n=1 Tax=Capnocytophaga cynodegmi TaxID=28189 RepID=A0A0B7HDG4_9FLAO|nr:hypothetical protein CCYN2B_40066 [Capnocytophaga cynodegmi]
MIVMDIMTEVIIPITDMDIILTMVEDIIQDITMIEDTMTEDIIMETIAEDTLLL